MDRRKVVGLWSPFTLRLMYGNICLSYDIKDPVDIISIPITDRTFYLYSYGLRLLTSVDGCLNMCNLPQGVKESLNYGIMNKAMPELMDKTINFNNLIYMELEFDGPPLTESEVNAYSKCAQYHHYNLYEKYNEEESKETGLFGTWIFTH